MDLKDTAQQALQNTKDSVQAHPYAATGGAVVGAIGGGALGAAGGAAVGVAGAEAFSRLGKGDED